MKMRTLVTGGSGFLGSFLCEALLSEGHTVLAIDNLMTGSLANIAHLNRDPRFDFAEWDICKAFDFGKFDFIFNFASPASPVDYHERGIETLKTGSQGTLHCLEAAKRYSAKFMMASTSECYGDPLVHPQPESYWGNVNSVGPRSVYDEAKRFSESLTVAFRRYHNVDTRIVRIFNTYGPRMRLNDGRVIVNFMTQALRGDDITVYGDGSQTRSFCYVDDEITGILAFAKSIEPGPINIGNPNEFTVLACAKAVLEVTGSKSQIVFQPLPQDDPKQRCPDISRAQQLLSWEPKIQLAEGLKCCLVYFRDAVAHDTKTKTVVEIS